MPTSLALQISKWFIAQHGRSFVRWHNHQFMAAFGNAEFERPEPYDQVAYAVGHHDRGWDAADATTVLDPKSRFPRGIGTAPLPPGGGNTSILSPDFNQRHHDYCGLLTSMHSWGLYNTRYGFSEFRVRPGGSTSIPIRPDRETETHAMLDGELARQDRLKATLASDPETALWVEDNRLMANYKLLQFFDTLALYFHLRHASEHGELDAHPLLTGGIPNSSITIGVRSAPYR